jgi:hypothetical protein
MPERLGDVVRIDRSCRQSDRERLTLGEAARIIREAVKTSRTARRRSASSSALLYVVRIRERCRRRA